MYISTNGRTKPIMQMKHTAHNAITDSIISMVVMPATIYPLTAGIRFSTALLNSKQIQTSRHTIIQMMTVLSILPIPQAILRQSGLFLNNFILRLKVAVWINLTKKESYRSRSINATPATVRAAAAIPKAGRIEYMPIAKSFTTSALA